MDEYTFGPGGEYRVLVAADRRSRERAMSLVYGVYLAGGLTEPRPARMEISLHDALPGTVSFLAERAVGAPAAVASLTLIPDSPLSLPLDRIARPALQGLRSAGRRPCEIARLATVAATERKEGGRAPREMILLHLFKMAYLAARRLEEATDLVAAVSHHQERYFRRVLLFEPLNGPGKGAGDGLTVPLRLDLEGAEERYRKRYGRRRGERNLYRFFVDGREPEVVEWLRAARRPPSTEEIGYFFARKTDLLRKADEAARRFILELHPELEIEG